MSNGNFKFVQINTNGLLCMRLQKMAHYHTGQCKRTGGCYNELVVAFLRTGGGLKGKKIYTC